MLKGVSVLLQEANDFVVAILQKPSFELLHGLILRSTPLVEKLPKQANNRGEGCTTSGKVQMLVLQNLGRVVVAVG